jgi:hypothetical protein
MKYLPKLMLYVIAKSLLIPLGAALIMAFVWDVLDWMRNYGSGMPVIPQLTNTPVQALAVASSENHAVIDSFITWYNFTFLGAARFGNALGIVLGGICVLCTLRHYSLIEKYIATALIGLLIGGRVGLLISSSSHIFVGGSVIGVLVGALSTFILRQADYVPDLPVSRFGDSGSID